jgi:prepilin-type cleavage/methylation N-terminal domain protein
MRNTKKGFTLVELIVVITILAVLATIAFLTLGDYPAQSRDTKRQASVANILEKIKVESATGYKSFIE